MARIPVIVSQSAAVRSNALLAEVEDSLFIIHFNLSPFRLRHPATSPALDFEWPHPSEQRARDHALHGMGIVLVHYSDTEEVPHHPWLWPTHRLLLSLGRHARR